MEKNNEAKLMKEVMEVISDGQNEILDEKKIAYDKNNQQFSIKIPKSIALKAKIDEDSIFGIIFNPKESKENIEKAKFVIYLKGEKNGEREKTA